MYTSGKKEAIVGGVAYADDVTVFSSVHPTCLSSAECRQGGIVTSYEFAFSITRESPWHATPTWYHMHAASSYHLVANYGRKSFKVL
jgi:hypothetical protein